MLKHRGRTITVLVGIALGAAVFTSIRLSIHASLDSFSKSMNSISGRTDWTVVRPGGRVSDTLVGLLLRHPCVRAASPILSTYVKPMQKEAEPFLLVGVDPIMDRSLRSWQIDRLNKEDAGLWLDLLKYPYTMFIGHPLSRQFELAAGDFLTLEHTFRKSDFRVLGKLAPEGPAIVEGGRIAITDIATFQEFTNLHGLIDRIDLRLRPAVSENDLEGIRRLLPEGVFLQSPTETRKSGQQMIQAYQLNLSILSFVSLFVGMFLVYSILALNAASRRHELAILRSIGASSHLLFLLFLSEGLFLGVAGWLMAIPISSFLVKYLLYGVSKTISVLFVRVHVENLVLSGWEILLSFGITVFISALSAYHPARKAMHVDPKEVLSISRQEKILKKSPFQLAVIGFFFIFFVWPLSRLPVISGFPLAGYVAIFLLLTGFSFLSPWGLHAMGNFFALFLGRLGGEPARLAGLYVRDSGSRTSISVGALITAVALYTALVIMVHSFRETVEIWVNQTISGDLFLRPKMADINHHRDPLPPEVIRTIKNIKAPVDLVPYRRFYLNYDEALYQFEAMDFQNFARYGKFFWIKGNPSQSLPKLIEGEGVLVSEVFASQTGLTVGDFYQSRIEGAALQLPILGVIRDYRTQGGVVYYSLGHFQQKINRDGPAYEEIWGGVRIFFRDRTQDLEAVVSNLRGQLFDNCGDNLEMISGKKMRHNIMQIFDETFAITSVLLLIALIVAGLGITISLTMLVLERSRQLHTILAVGGSFRQIRSMVFWEAFIMVVTGECAGLLCGFFLSYLLVYVINFQSFGWTFLYRVDWRAIGISLPLILITALFASLPAVYLVFRQSPSNLLREC